VGPKPASIHPTTSGVGLGPLLRHFYATGWGLQSAGDQFQPRDANPGIE